MASWQNSLKTRLAKSPRPKVAVLGIGHELRGDDAVGVIVAQELSNARRGLPNPRLADGSDDPSGANRVLIIEAGAVPEAFTGPLRRFAPDLVVMIDAAQMDLPPGTIRAIEWQDAIGLSASTHTLPLNVIAQYLISELQCEILIIGIQPQANEFDTPLSPAVRQAVDELTQALTALFT